MARSIDQVVSILDEKLRWSDLVQPFEFAHSDWHLVRPFGDVWTDYRHVVTTKTGKRYYEYCRAWDSAKDGFVAQRDQVCECCRVQFAHALGAAGHKIAGQYRYYMNVILYGRTQAGTLKEKGIYMLEMASSLFKKIKELKGANNGVAVTDLEKGALILIKFDKSQDPSNMYSASLDTKNVPISASALKLTVRQKFPGGDATDVEAKKGMPAHFEYIRTTSSADEMSSSLRTHGYYQETISLRPDYSDVPPPSVVSSTADDELMPY